MLRGYCAEQRKEHAHTRVLSLFSLTKNFHKYRVVMAVSLHHFWVKKEKKNSQFCCSLETKHHVQRFTPATHDALRVLANH